MCFAGFQNPPETTEQNDKDQNNSSMNSDNHTEENSSAEDSAAEKLNDSNGDVNNRSDTPVTRTSSIPLTLEYLNTMCLRSRLQYLVHILKNYVTEEEVDLMQMFQDCILRHDLERLRCIVRSS